MTREQIRSYLELYRDLGVDSVYTRVAAAPAAKVDDAEAGKAFIDLSALDL